VIAEILFHSRKKNKRVFSSTSWLCSFKNNDLPKEKNSFPFGDEADEVSFWIAVVPLIEASHFLK